MKRSILLAFVLALAATPGLAQSHSPYAGMQQRPIKALSEQQVADLEAGRGMGLALAAELNGYPGPSHVLELADKLGLTAEQRRGVQRLFDAMKAEAIPLGARLLAQERSLDAAFAGRTATPENLETATSEIGATQAALRNTHLKYHLRMVQILSAEQMRRYSVLRGYASDANRHQHPH